MFGARGSTGCWLFSSSDPSSVPTNRTQGPMSVFVDRLSPWSWPFLTLSSTGAQGSVRGLQPGALMIISCEVVVMVWPRHQWLFCCLHTVLDGFGGVCTLRRRWWWTGKCEGAGGLGLAGILMFIYTAVNKMCARQQGETEWWRVIKPLCLRCIHYPYSSLHT